MQKSTFIFCLFVLVCFDLFSQQDTSINFKARKIILVSSSAGFAVGSLAALSQLWYADYNTGQFHFFNDNAEWLQMDKIGHACANYQTSRLMMNAFKLAGFNKKQQMLYGGGIGFVYMTAIELMDGFSDGWGFSWGDQIANALGTGLAVGQSAVWNEQKIYLKFSYSPSGLAKYNPSLLGKTINSQILKDYNGQTYWLSFNPFDFSKNKTKLPHWLNLSFGYSAFGMIGGHENKIVALDNNGNAIKFNRERRFYFSLDLNLNKINTKNKLLKKVFSVLSILKVPFPALEFSKNGAQFYPLYY
jgi:hypothetical protein